MQAKMTWAVLLGTTLAIAALYHARKVHATTAATNVHAYGCSVASLKGTYVFRRMGMNNVVGGPIAQIGTDVFNGDGTRGRVRSTRSTNGQIRDWVNSPPNGTYTVDPDCTGSFFDGDGAKTNNVVVLDGGKRFFLLSVAPDTIVTEEGNKLEVED
jgi:hypothetical protein